MRLLLRAGPRRRHVVLAFHGIAVFASQCSTGGVRALVDAVGLN